MALMDMLELWVCSSLGTGVTILLLFVLDSRCVEVSWLCAGLSAVTLRKRQSMGKNKIIIYKSREILFYFQHW